MVLYKVSSMGYFGGVAKVSRGPWFRDYFVEDDGLDWFYLFKDSEGKRCYLLSNNLALEDREAMNSLYLTMNRNNRMAWFGGLFLSTPSCPLPSGSEGGGGRNGRGDSKGGERQVHSHLRVTRGVRGEREREEGKNIKERGWGEEREREKER